MKKQTTTIHDAIEPFIHEENISLVLETLYPLLSVKGKKEVKEFWKDNGKALSHETYDAICTIVKDVTGVEVSKTKNRTKETTLSQFLISFALYYEFVVCKKITLKNLCEQYMPTIKHSQILYAVHAVEKSISLPSVFEIVSKFALALEQKGFACVNRRLIELSAELLKNKTANEAQHN